MNLREWNEVYFSLSKRFDALYHNVAVKYGFSDTQYWVLYILYTCDENKIYVQNELAEEIGAPKQTVNSVISKFVKDGYLVLTQRKGVRNGKYVELTDKGTALCEICILPLLKAEEQALEKIAEEDHRRFLDLYENRYQKISNEIEKLLDGIA